MMSRLVLPTRPIRGEYSENMPFVNSCFKSSSRGKRTVLSDSVVGLKGSHWLIAEEPSNGWQLMSC